MWSCHKVIVNALLECAPHGRSPISSYARSVLMPRLSHSTVRTLTSGRWSPPPPAQPPTLTTTTATTTVRGGGLFAVNKPVGISSTTIVDLVQHTCRRNPAHPLVRQLLAADNSKRARRGLVKVGHGGTLDPLARGVVVIGMGSGCKKLHGMTSSSKIYVAEARLGFSSTTLDCTGSLLTQGPTDHVTKERLLETLIAFRGEIRQTPPLYSALSMDGKRLYDYAREGVPLPREIPERTVQIHELDLLSFPGPDGVTECSPDLVRLGFRSHHPRSNDAQDETAVNTLPFESRSGFKPKPLLHDPNATNDATFVPLPDPSQPGSRGLYFHLRVHCSSGTYIRTLIADIATRLGTVGHMTDLLRTEQKGFMLDGGMTIEMSDCEDLDRVDQAILASQLEESKSGP